MSYDNQWDPYDELMRHRDQIHSLCVDVVNIADAHNVAQKMINDLTTQNRQLLKVITLQQEQIEMLRKDIDWVEAELGVPRPAPPKPN